jgi:hypothetical protein
MLSGLLLVVLTQVACSPGEMSVVCSCKQGMVSACMTLAGNDASRAAQVLDEVQEILEQASWKAGEEEKKQQLQTAAESLSQALGSSEPPQCKGQQHHLISRRIAKGLSRHPTLKGFYEPRDPRFVSRAKDEQSHCGYQEWHRKVDEEVVKWLEQFPQATPKQFMDKLRDIYSRPEMKARFPNGF